MRLSKEVKTGILVLVAIGFVIYGYNFMKGHNLFDSNRQLYAVYDGVEGLSSNASVTINGKKVGKVSEINFLNDTGKLVVTLEIKSDFKFSKESTAEIYSQGFIEGKSVKIVPKYQGGPAKSGDTLNSKIEVDVIDNLRKHLDPLQKKLDNALGQIDTLLQGINNVIDTTGQRDLNGSLANFNSTMAHLNSSTATLDNLLAKNSVKLDTTINHFSSTAYNLSKFSDSLAQIEVGTMTHKLDNVLTNFDEVSTKLNSGKGTAGKLINDDKVYNNLDRATAQLDELLQDIKLNPGRYVSLKFSIFGGKDKSKPYKRPKDSLK